MIGKRRFMIALATLAGGGMAIALGVMPAVGQSSPPSSAVILNSTGTLLNRGAAAQVSALVACPAGDYAQLFVSLNEKSGSGIASGGGYADFTCNSQIETITEQVPANSKPFVAGSAFAQATLFDCGPASCNQTNVSGSIKLTKK